MLKGQSVSQLEATLAASLGDNYLWGGQANDNE